jgi:aminopeptidase
MSREFYEIASEEQIKFFPEKFLKGRIEQIDSSISIISENNPFELKGVDGKKIMLSGKTFKPYMEWKEKKENEGKFSWTLALYPTLAKAQEAGLSLEEYWEQVTRACFLDDKNPVNKWREVVGEIDKLKEKLNKMEIKNLYIKSKNIDLKIAIGKDRKWLGGRGANIPSFELFITPDYRFTEGKICFDMPLYRYGNLIKDIELVFKNGEVVEYKASTGLDILKSMIESDFGSRRVGEFSLTDKRFSRINKFMAETLYDENFGGEYGNTHIALGSSYKDSYAGDIEKLNKKEWDDLGFNDSSVHTDIISSEDREVFAELYDGQRKLIYKEGVFVI